MKLLLCSEGFHTPNTTQACVELCDKPKDQITIAVINEAFAAELGDKRWVLDNLNSVAQNFPAEMDIVDLLALPLTEVEARIMQKDAIFVVGGHTDYLMSVFRKTGFDKLLPKLLESKVYVGSSAGSMVIGRRLSEEAYGVMYGERGAYGVGEYLGLVDFSIMPHLNSEHFPSRKEMLVAAVAHHSGLVYGLNDDSAVVVNGENMQIIGSHPLKIQNGKILQNN